MGLNISDGILLVLFAYFLLMNFTVEKNYCYGDEPLQSDTRFLMPETYEFSKEHNKLFLARPDWLVKATCVSASVLAMGYIALIFVTLTNSWKKLAVPVLLFLGAKMYGIFFYHFMEFTNTEGLAPAASSLVPYFSAEGPYLVAMVIVLMKVAAALNGGGGSKSKRS